MVIAPASRHMRLNSQGGALPVCRGRWARERFTTTSVRKRRRWDSNPRDPCGPTGFQDRRIRPLCHSSDCRRARERSRRAAVALYDHGRSISHMRINVTSCVLLVLHIGVVHAAEPLTKPAKILLDETGVLVVDGK